MLHQQIAQAVGFLGHQHDEVLPALVYQPYISLLAELSPDFRQETIVEVSLQVGAHEEAALVSRNIFLVLDDVESVKKTDLGDFVNEPGLIGRVGQKNLAFHLLFR